MDSFLLAERPILTQRSRFTMKLICFSIFLVASLATSQIQAADDGWVSLFDGQTLKGWTQLNGTATYEVKDGTIVGTTAEGSPNSFLCSDQLYDDFELEFEVKVHKKLNSGVQIRSTQRKEADPNIKNDRPGRVNGPQVEIMVSPGHSGWIYGEGTGLGWLSPEPKDQDPTKSQNSHMKNDEWNSIRVVAKGATIQTFINGQSVADLTDEGIYKTHPKGFIGLQVHSIGKGQGPFNVAWKNIRIKALD